MMMVVMMMTALTTASVSLSSLSNHTLITTLYIYALRSTVWNRALLIQRVYRGHKARYRAFIGKVRAKVAADNRLYFGKHKGATQMQRIFRGFKVRRGLVRELRLAASWTIQCWFRQYRARQRKTWHQVRRDAITMLSKNIWLMLRYDHILLSLFSPLPSYSCSR